jgi:hypothetical protein
MGLRQVGIDIGPEPFGGRPEPHLARQRGQRPGSGQPCSLGSLARS